MRWWTALRIETAYLTLIEQLSGAAERVVVLGDSAGAHLTALLLLRLHRRDDKHKVTPRAAILSSPVLCFVCRAVESRRGGAQRPAAAV